MWLAEDGLDEPRLEAIAEEVAPFGLCIARRGTRASSRGARTAAARRPRDPNGRFLPGGGGFGLGPGSRPLPPRFRLKRRKEKLVQRVVDSLRRPKDPVTHKFLPGRLEPFTPSAFARTLPYSWDIVRWSADHARSAAFLLQPQPPPPPQLQLQELPRAPTGLLAAFWPRDGELRDEDWAEAFAGGPPALEDSSLASDADSSVTEYALFGDSSVVAAPESSLSDAADFGPDSSAEPLASFLRSGAGFFPIRPPSPASLASLCATPSLSDATAASDSALPL